LQCVIFIVARQYKIRKDKQMQLIAALIIIGILVLLLGAAMYFARGQKTRNDPYRSWSQVLGPQFRGSAFDVGEKLNEEIEAGRQQAHRTRRTKRSRD
jgi:hypothetical protein